MLVPIVLAAHCLFAPPSGWEIADPKTPSKRSIVGFVSRKRSGFCPSLNLTSEKISIPMSDYLSIIKKVCEAKKQVWRHLGKVTTKSGPAELVEIEAKTAFGQVRLLQAILEQKGELFIMTAGVIKKDFHLHAKEFQRAIASMVICEDLVEQVEGPEARERVRTAWQKRDLDIDSYKKIVLEQKELGAVWQLQMLQS